MWTGFRPWETTQTNGYPGTWKNQCPYCPCFLSAIPFLHGSRLKKTNNTKLKKLQEKIEKYGSSNFVFLCLRRSGGRFLKKRGEIPPWTPRKNFCLSPFGPLQFV
jgi:hypothetical protein